MKKAAFHTLGCKVNQYETEAIMEQFRRAGFEIVGEEDFADCYVINTCTVTNLADRKSRQYIRRAGRRNPDAVVAVTGCYVQVHPEEAAELEGVTVLCGTDRKHRLVELVQEQLEKRGAETVRRTEILQHAELTGFEDLGTIQRMAGRARAFVKIQDGCENFCSYCIIPYARGRNRSRRPEDVVREVRGLVDAGIREIVLTGINTANYGRDLGSGDGLSGRGGRTGLEALLAELNDLEGEFRLRLSSLEPTQIDAAYVKKLLPFDQLCHHLHLALQSGSDKVLQEMNRRYSMRDFYAITDVLRDFDPHYGISTDIIVGFPGETEADFAGSLETVERLAFCKTHVFKYSMRDGTPAAGRKDQVPGEVKNERSRLLLEAADRAQAAFVRENAGSVRRVLCEKEAADPVTGDGQGIEAGALPPRPEGGTYCIGYTDNYIRTFVPFGEEEDPDGKFADVRLTMEAGLPVGIRAPGSAE